MDSVGEGEGGKIWKNDIETCKISCMKRVASPGSMHDTGCLGLVHWDDPEGWYRPFRSHPRLILPGRPCGRSPAVDPADGPELRQPRAGAFAGRAEDRAALPRRHFARPPRFRHDAAPFDPVAGADHPEPPAGALQIGRAHV